MGVGALPDIGVGTILTLRARTFYESRPMHQLSSCLLLLASVVSTLRGRAPPSPPPRRSDASSSRTSYATATHYCCLGSRPSAQRNVYSSDSSSRRVSFTQRPRRCMALLHELESRLWRCLSYRGSAGGYLFIECRGVAALQMRSSQ